MLWRLQAVRTNLNGIRAKLGKPIHRQKACCKDPAKKIRPEICIYTQDPLYLPKQIMICNSNIQAWWWRSLTLVDNECG